MVLLVSVGRLRRPRAQVPQEVEVVGARLEEGLLVLAPSVHLTPVPSLALPVDKKEVWVGNPPGSKR